MNLINEIDYTPPSSVPELLTIKQASRLIGVQYRQLLNAVNSGTVPHYKIGKSRQLVNVQEVISIMKKNGGHHES